MNMNLEQSLVKVSLHNTEYRNLWRREGWLGKTWMLAVDKVEWGFLSVGNKMVIVSKFCPRQECNFDMMGRAQ